jgi:hypothetical protein
MSFDHTIRSLLSAAGRSAERRAARALWAEQTAVAWREAQRKINDAWERVFAALPDDLSDEEIDALEIPDPPEQAELDALQAQIDDVIERDKWPRHLYFGCI